MSVVHNELKKYKDAQRSVVGGFAPFESKRALVLQKTHFVEIHTCRGSTNKRGASARRTAAPWATLSSPYVDPPGVPVGVY